MAKKKNTAVVKAAPPGEVDEDFQADEGGEDSAASNEVLDAMELGLSSALSTLKRIDTAKDSDLKQQSDAFWKPTKDGEELRGVYLGKMPAGRLTQYCIGKLDEDGKPVIYRFNGTNGIRSKLTADRVNQGVRLVFRGKSTTGNNRQFKNFDVYWLK